MPAQAQLIEPVDAVVPSAPVLVALGVKVIVFPLKVPSLLLNVTVMTPLPLTATLLTYSPEIVAGSPAALLLEGKEPSV